MFEALTDRLQANLGVHLQHFALNGRTSVEPRVSLKWALDADQSLALGYGLHSQLDELSLYLSEQTVGGRTVQPNRDLDFSKAHHLTLAYQRRLGPHSHRGE